MLFRVVKKMTVYTSCTIISLPLYHSHLVPRDCQTHTPHSGYILRWGNSLLSNPFCTPDDGSACSSGAYFNAFLYSLLYVYHRFRGSSPISLKLSILAIAAPSIVWSISSLAWSLTLIRRTNQLSIWLTLASTLTLLLFSPNSYPELRF